MPLQLVGKRCPLKAVRTLRKKKSEEEKTIRFIENILGSMGPFVFPIEFFMLDAISPIGSP